MSNRVRVLFVCLGNICRSPMAEGMFRAEVEAKGLADAFVIDSAGTSGVNTGRGPDPRAKATALRHGVELRGTARQLTADELNDWDFIIVMDDSNYKNVLALGADPEKVHRMRDFDPEGGGEVPDPFYGDAAGFEETYAILQRSMPGLLRAVGL